MEGGGPERPPLGFRPSGLKHALSTQNLRRKLLKRGRLLSYIDGILGVFEGTLRG